jgi:hypothetical protein
MVAAHGADLDAFPVIGLIGRTAPELGDLRAGHE